MTRPDFGQVIGWTVGGTKQGNLVKTQAMIQQLPERADALRKAGVTPTIAKRWAEFYQAEAVRVPGNPNALPRSQLMRAIQEILE